MILEVERLWVKGEIILSLTVTQNRTTTCLLNIKIQWKKLTKRETYECYDAAASNFQETKQRRRRGPKGTPGWQRPWQCSKRKVLILQYTPVMWCLLNYITYPLPPARDECIFELASTKLILNKINLKVKFNIKFWIPN